MNCVRCEIEIGEALSFAAFGSVHEPVCEWCWFNPAAYVDCPDCEGSGLTVVEDICDNCEGKGSWGATTTFYRVDAIIFWNEWATTTTVLRSWNECK